VTTVRFEGIGAYLPRMLRQIRLFADATQTVVEVQITGSATGTQCTFVPLTPPPFSRPSPPPTPTPSPTAPSPAPTSTDPDILSPMRRHSSRPVPSPTLSTVVPASPPAASSQKVHSNPLSHAQHHRTPPRHPTSHPPRILRFPASAVP
jgi:hypothetical protein